MSLLKSPTNFRKSFNLNECIALFNEIDNFVRPSRISINSAKEFGLLLGSVV